MYILNLYALPFDIKLYMKNKIQIVIGDNGR